MTSASRSSLALVLYLLLSQPSLPAADTPTANAGEAAGALPAAHVMRPPQAQPALRDGLKLVEMEWRDLAVHPVTVDGATGAIRVQAHLPADRNLAKDKPVPLGFGVEIRFVFDFAVGDRQPREARLGFSLTAPKAGRKWLKPFAESAKKQGLKHSLEDGALVFESPISIGEAWWLTLPVTSAAAAGEYRYAIAIEDKPVAEGRFAFTELPESEKDDLQRATTVYFFARVAYPKFAAWVEERGGRLPTTKEFLAELDSLEYFPANDYTAHRGLPKRMEQIEKPDKTWLARECRAACDGKVVVVYADGSIGLGEPIEAGDDREVE